MTQTWPTEAFNEYEELKMVELKVWLYLGTGMGYESTYSTCKFESNSIYMLGHTSLHFFHRDRMLLHIFEELRADMFLATCFIQKHT